MELINLIASTPLFDLHPLTRTLLVVGLVLLLVGAYKGLELIGRRLNS